MPTRLQPATLVHSCPSCVAQLSSCFCHPAWVPGRTGGSQRPEEALVTGSANTAEASAGCDQAHLLIPSAERSPGGSHTALAMAMHV